MMTQLIDQAYEKALAGQILSKDEIVRLMNIPTGSDECDYLRQQAHRLSIQMTGGKAYLWGAIGLDYTSCPMSCDFCSFGNEWGLIKDEKVYSIEEIIRQVSKYVADGVHFIVLRTTQFYSIDTLLHYVRTIRSQVAGDYEIIVNVGEFDQTTAESMHQAGISGVYHAIRLREGINTRFRVEDRLKTLAAVKASPLNLIHLVEPVGPEHTYEEMAERFLCSLQYGAYISGIMARIPVKGTPLGEGERISDAEIAKLIAVLRLSGGHAVESICVHPASELAIQSGANVAVIECGAIPRDHKLATSMWQQFDSTVARTLFTQNGFEIA